MLKTKIFVDGNCIVCDTEVSHYKRMAPEMFDIVDISAPGFDAGQFGFTAEAVNKEMHVITPEGEVLKAIDAFAHIWSRLNYYRWAGKVIKFPVVYQLAKIGYRIFAANRHRLPKRRNRS